MSNAYTYKDAILWSFLSEAPEDWSYEKIIEKLSSEDFYRSTEDPECPDDEALSTWEVYDDWNTKFLAEHIESVVNAVGETLDNSAKS